MSSENEDFSGNYDPSRVEAAAYAVWMDEGAFKADPARSGPAYSIVIPPPNVTGALHLGHAINNTLQDILVRMHRMRGDNTLWVPGIDHAGIATQAVVEKQLKEKENKTRHDVGREGLVERIWTWKEQFGDRIIEQLKRIGASCDWDRTRFTLDETCARAVRQTFFKLFRDGLIYRGKRLVNWDVFLQTSVSDDEIYHETVKTSLWHLRYPIEGSEKFMVVATTRPETMLGDTAVAVHSEDSRWNWAIGRKVRLPLTDRLIPIIADDILVDPKFGSGVVKVTPGHDPNDYAVWQRHAGQGDAIELINILTPQATLNENAGAYAGMGREAARKKVVADLDQLGLLEKEEAYETQVGHSDRSKTPIEPYLSDQWFVHMAPLAEPALEAVRQGKVRFSPDRYARTYLDWLGEKRDWPISRQLWWGHRIPVWSSATARIELDHSGDASAAASVIRDGVQYVCLRDSDPAMIERLEKAGFIQDPDVLDTWFSSALWPHSTLGWPEATAALSRWYPTSTLVTSRDIITLWVARMVMTGLYNLGQVPFHEVYIHPTILDGKGERMSKSKGNGVDPVDIILTHGADALRFTLTQMATETQDVRMPVKRLPDGRNTSDRFDAGRNFCNKLWNAAKFVLTQVQAHPPTAATPASLSLADRWIVSRFHRAVAEADAALAQYRFDQYARSVYDFFWRDLCDWHLEASKPALKDPARAATTNAVLAAMLDGALRLLHPVIPFITETLWWRLNDARPERVIPGHTPYKPSRRLIAAEWPKTGECDEAAEHLFSRMQEIITTIRNVRNEYKADPKRPSVVSILAAPDLEAEIDANRELIETLGICVVRRVEPGHVAGDDVARATAAGCELFLEGLVDPDAERQRLSRRRDELHRQIAALRGRLGNDTYVAKAPAHLVQQTRDQLTAAEVELTKLDAA